MRILAFTDIHGAYDRVSGVLSSEQTYDVILIGGDLTTFGTHKEAAAALKSFGSFGKPVLIVAGNMDPPSLEETFAQQATSINGSGIVIDRTGFFGVSAAPFSPLKTPYEISEEEISSRAEWGSRAVAGAERRVFVPHAPPFDTALDTIHSGKHVGSTAVRKFIDTNHPDVVVCGHIHEARGIDHLGSTTIVNCGPAGKGFYAVINLGPDVSVELRG